MFHLSLLVVGFVSRITQKLLGGLNHKTKETEREFHKHIRDHGGPGRNTVLCGNEVRGLSLYSAVSALRPSCNLWRWATQIKLIWLCLHWRTEFLSAACIWFLRNLRSVIRKEHQRSLISMISPLHETGLICFSAQTRSRTKNWLLDEKRLDFTSRCFQSRTQRSAVSLSPVRNSPKYLSQAVSAAVWTFTSAVKSKSDLIPPFSTRGSHTRRALTSKCQ